MRNTVLATSWKAFNGRQDMNSNPSRAGRMLTTLHTALTSVVLYTTNTPDFGSGICRNLLLWHTRVMCKAKRSPGISWRRHKLVKDHIWDIAGRGYSTSCCST